MKKIRLLAALMALLLVVGLFAACSKKQSAAPGTTAPKDNTNQEDPTTPDVPTEDPGCDDNVTEPVDDPTEPNDTEPTEPSVPETTDPENTNPESSTPDNEPDDGNQEPDGGSQGGTESNDPELSISFVDGKKELSLKVSDAPYTLYNGTAPIAEVTFDTSDKTICTFDGGVVTPVASGVATVKATYNGKTLECTVRIIGQGGAAGNEIDFDDLLNAGK